VNLGPEVNSEFDDIAPYLSRSGRKLYLSSDRLSSIGGFDIFMVEYNTESMSWSTVKNLGLPINSPMDDLHFSLSADGTAGVFSSNRIDSKGGFDLYMAYMKNQVTDQLMYTESVPFGTTSDDIANIDSIKTNTATTITRPQVKAQESFNSPLFYSSNENVLNATNTKQLKRIKDIMIILPEVNVMFTSHALREGMTEFDLYFSIKRAEKAADYLSAQGIDPSRIFLRGLGANFPLVKEIINGRTSRLAEKNNRRLEVSFFNAKSGTLELIDDEPVVADNLVDPRGQEYKDKLQGLSYKILISTVKQMFKGDILKKYEDATIEKRLDSEFYDYTLGLFDRYDEARILKNKLIREGVQDAIVLVYLNGKVLTKEEIQSSVDTYPDLARYLQFE